MTLFIKDDFLSICLMNWHNTYTLAQLALWRCSSIEFMARWLIVVCVSRYSIRFSGRKIYCTHGNNTAPTLWQRKWKGKEREREKEREGLTDWISSLQPNTNRSECSCNLTCDCDLNEKHVAGDDWSEHILFFLFDGRIDVWRRKIYDFFCILQLVDIFLHVNNTFFMLILCRTINYFSSWTTNLKLSINQKINHICHEKFYSKHTFDLKTEGSTLKYANEWIWRKFILSLNTWRATSFIWAFRMHICFFDSQ